MDAQSNLDLGSFEARSTLCHVPCHAVFVLWQHVCPAVGTNIIMVSQCQAGVWADGWTCGIHMNVRIQGFPAEHVTL